MLVSSFLEIFLYNYGFWKTRKNNLDNNLSVEYSEGISESNDQKWILSAGESSLYVEIMDINMPLNCIEFDARWADKENEDNDVQYRIYAKDEGNSYYLQLPDVYVNSLIPGSKYINLHLAGNVKSLKLEIIPIRQIGEAGAELLVNNITLNPKRKMDISIIRLVTLFCMLAVIIFSLPIVGLWKIKVNDKSMIQKLIMAFIITIEIGLAVIVIHKVDYSGYNGQYIEMAKALSKGQVYLDAEVSDSLLELSNPYDTNLRKNNNVDFKWDYAYYNGYYYVYFGVVPDILLFCLICLLQEEIVLALQTI